MGNWIKQHLLTVVMTAGMLIGISLLLYPSVANYWNTYHSAKVIMDYTETVTNLDKTDYKRILDSARAYNKRLAETGIKWMLTDAERDEYNKELAVDDSGIMGFVSLPKFHVRCPIYHGTDEEVLQTAIGHLEGSSLPIGGKSTHSMISGHRGMPSARLFTDLNKVKEGDTWTITVLNETVTYECDQIRIVLPEDLSDLNIEEGKDLCTLITCTPYGVNTHRLLVRGHRVPNANGSADVTADAIQIEPIFIAPFLAGPILLILLIILLVSTRRAKRVGPDQIITQYLEKKGLKKCKRTDTE
ncbi:MAG: class C sortase [Mogibacterium sp.]|nr:class C sortase [Mogibacterium sp.]MBR6731076.1 class C sortase [Bacteroidales bacterium]